MQEIITNYDNLKESDITEVVRRVKILLVNSRKEILLGYSFHEYQLPGGHVEEGEELITAVNREITEETGMVLNLTDLKPFAKASGYYKDWPEVGKNRKIEIYYYKVLTDEKINLQNTHYTEHEKEGNFELRYIPLERIEEEIKSNAQLYGDKKGIAEEMLKLFKIYKNN